MIKGISRINKTCVFIISMVLMVTPLCAQTDKAPAYPLITHDPYFSIWSFTDTLQASPTRHWTGASHSLVGLLKVDNQLYHFMGEVESRYVAVVPTSEEADYTVR
jgi:hypothetical protein